MTKRDLLNLKEKLEAKRLEKATKEGQLEAEKKKLKEEFGVKGAKEAKEKLVKMEGELDSMEAEYEKGVASFEEKYAELLAVV